MKFALFALGVVVAASAMGSRAEAQNYPWCAYWHGTGGARNCGFVGFAQCQLTARAPAPIAAPIRNTSPTSRCARRDPERCTADPRIAPGSEP